jgi:hypothetical protein
MQLPRKEFVVCNAYIHLVQTRRVPDAGRVSRSRAKARRAARQNRHSKGTKAQSLTEAPFDVRLAGSVSVEIENNQRKTTPKWKPKPSKKSFIYVPLKLPHSTDARLRRNTIPR